MIFNDKNIFSEINATAMSSFFFTIIQLISLVTFSPFYHYNLEFS